VFSFIVTLDDLKDEFVLITLLSTLSTDGTPDIGTLIMLVGHKENL
jgi:hypothetical protein